MKRQDGWPKDRGGRQGVYEPRDRVRGPIFNLYLPGMREFVRELFESRRVEGRRVKELLRLGIPR
jgi:hypothetical protein